MLRCGAQMLVNGVIVRCRLNPMHPGWHTARRWRNELRWPRLPTLRELQAGLVSAAKGCIQ